MELLMIIFIKTILKIKNFYKIQIQFVTIKIIIIIKLIKMIKN
jgi:hypothetical protein